MTGKLQIYAKRYNYLQFLTKCYNYYTNPDKKVTIIFSVFNNKKLRKVCEFFLKKVIIGNIYLQRTSTVVYLHGPFSPTHLHETVKNIYLHGPSSPTNLHRTVKETTSPLTSMTVVPLGRTSNVLDEGDNTVWPGDSTVSLRGPRIYYGGHCFTTIPSKCQYSDHGLSRFHPRTMTTMRHGGINPGVSRGEYKCIRAITRGHIKENLIHSHLNTFGC